MPADHKLQIRLTAEQRTLLEAAADYQGLTLTDFIRSSAIVAARAITTQQVPETPADAYVPQSEPIYLEIDGDTWDLITDLEDIEGDPGTDETVVLYMTDGTEVEYTMGTDDAVDIYLWEHGP